MLITSLILPKSYTDHISEYDVTCFCRDNGLILKAGEVFGGRSRALNVIANNAGNIQAASQQTGISSALDKISETIS